MIYLLMACLRYEDTNELILCTTSVADSLEGTTKYLFSIYDDALRQNQEADDQKNGTPSHDINSPNYVDYLYKNNIFLVPYASLRDKVRKKVPLNKHDFDGITTFGVGHDARPLNLYLTMYEIESYERALDIVSVIIDMLGDEYYQEYEPKINATENTGELFKYLFEACNRYNSSN